jgi:hypothetical protein
VDYAVTTANISAQILYCQETLKLQPGEPRLTYVARVFHVFLAEAIPGKEMEFNKWYDEQHIPLILRVNKYVKAVRRFSTDSEPRSMAIYEYDSLEDLERYRASPAAREVRGDYEKQVGVVVKGASNKVYNQVYPS